MACSCEYFRILLSSEEEVKRLIPASDGNVTAQFTSFNHFYF